VPLVELLPDEYRMRWISPASLPDSESGAPGAERRGPPPSSHVRASGTGGSGLLKNTESLLIGRFWRENPLVSGATLLLAPFGGATLFALRGSRLGPAAKIPPAGRITGDFTEPIAECERVGLMGCAGGDGRVEKLTLLGEVRPAAPLEWRAALTCSAFSE